MFDVLLVGCGKMGRALLEGIVAGDVFDVKNIAVLEPVIALRESISSAHPFVTLLDHPTDARVVIVATKPSQVVEVCRALSSIDFEVVISIAAGITVSTIEAALVKDAAVVRAMPNTPGQIGMGITAIAPGSLCTSETMLLARQVLAGLGEVIEVPEMHLDAVTALSGSGPAYVFYLAEAMIDAGVELGLSVELSGKLVAQTFAGSTELLKQRAMDTRALRLEVSSPGGTTIAATNAFDKAGIRAGIVAGIKASYDRSRSLNP